MSLSRLEVNLRRLLAKCELMVKNKQQDDQKFVKYVESLKGMLHTLKESDSSDSVTEYSRRISTLKHLIDNNGTENKGDEAGDNIPVQNLSSRQELLGTNDNLRFRFGKNDDLDQLLGFHHKMQEKIASDMLTLTQNLKEQSILANKIIKQDTEVASASTELAEKNFENLKLESDKLAEHSKRACKCWMWLMLIIVMVLFINMVFFMKIMKKSK